MDKETHILNPSTNRFVLVGSPKYKRLVKEGVIKKPEPQPAPSRPPSPEPAQARPSQSRSLKKEVMNVATNIVRDNRQDFVDLTQKQTDALLKRMLYEKLCVDKPSKKTHKKKRYDSSSDSSDSSDSN
jgi:hypothetical protein